MRKLNEAAMQAGDYMRNFWCVTPPAGTKPEDLLGEEIWIHVARKLRPRDRLEVMPEDSAWLAEYVVIHVSSTGATVQMLWTKDLDSVKANRLDMDDYEIEWSGIATKHRVIRKSDRTVMKDGLLRREDAVTWVTTNLVNKAA